MDGEWREIVGEEGTPLNLWNERNVIAEIQEESGIGTKMAIA